MCKELKIVKCDGKVKLVANKNGNTVFAMELKPVLIANGSKLYTYGEGNSAPLKDGDGLHAYYGAGTVVVENVVNGVVESNYTGTDKCDGVVLDISKVSPQLSDWFKGVM